ncbi:MAG: DUF1800 domain-containing protein [Saprospiraceae bacterium]|jgi:uncharacterized protein (DUF1800 family)|nr:DUF1800 domain-containing protein [Saprospiraceae bacterium]MBP6445773.1 DUF1800 domain-containing protein [Saprospiraceae bacterium]
MASLNKYSGAWNTGHTAHLFRRTTYGVKYDLIKEYGAKSLDATIALLFTPLQQPAPPINVNYATDPNVPIGQTWVDKATSMNVDGYRTQTLRAWSYDLMLSGTPNIREKMVMFLHNHFVTADINEPRYEYKNIALLRSRALGNFKQLTYDVTIDPGMLEYLNGNLNTKTAPNENYARELLELFTVGKGPIAGPGDYTTYTEGDIKEIAKVLTGWKDQRGAVPITSQFNLNLHDTTTKKLSARFNNVSISNSGINEYKELIDNIFNKEEVSLHICRRLYVWFVASNISSEIERDIIIPLAKIFRDSNYELLPTIKTLLESDHFYDVCTRGVMVKNPLDFLLNPLGQFEVTLPTDAVLRMQVLNNIYNTSVFHQMAMFRAPSVAGWQAYYQEPNYYKLWLNSVSLPSRKTYTDVIAGTGQTIGSFRLQLNILNTVNKFLKPEDAGSVVNEIGVLLFAKALAPNQVTLLKSILAAGTSDAGWTTAYNAYKAAPTDTTKLNTVVTRLRSMVTYMMRMPEYHLS